MNTFVVSGLIKRAAPNGPLSFSALIEKQFELDAGVGASDPNTRRNLMRFNVQIINNYHREYREYIAELHRRYPTI